MAKLTTAEHLSLHDRQIASIRSLIQEGMRLVVQTRKDMRVMLASQRRTEQNLADLIGALNRGSNGKPELKRKLPSNLKLP